MIWPRRGKLVNAPAPEGTWCPPAVWAAHGRTGPVPAGWVGLRVAPGAEGAAWVPAGQAVPTPRWGPDNSVVWWVRAEPWPLCFAPWPEQAPEAGLQLTLQLDVQAESSHRQLLANRLAALAADVDQAQWAAELRRHQAISALPPCATPLLLSARAETLGAALHPDWAVRVLSLQRCDLASASALPAPGEAGLAASPADVAAAAGKADDLGQTASRPTAGAGGAAHSAPDWQALLAQDAAVCHRLAHALPRLALALDRRGLGAGLSPDRAVAQRQIALSRRLGLMAAKTGAWVPLAPRPGARSAPSAVQRSLLALEAVRALESLVAADQALLAWPAPGRPPLAHHLGPLETAVDALERHLQLRLLPWWE